MLIKINKAIIIHKHIILGCQRNDKKAQKAFYNACCDLVFAVSKRYVGPDDFKDAAQNSFIKIYKNINKFQGSEKEIKSWITRITVNESLQLLRIRKRLVAKDASVVNTGYQEASIISELSLNELKSCISKIELNHRIVFMMYAIEGYSHKEIAEKLKIAEASSRARLSRSKTMIKNQIQKIKEYENAR